MPNIGQAFSPEMLSLITQKQEGAKNRNLEAAIADRQFREQALGRQAEVGLANQDNARRGQPGDGDVLGFAQIEADESQFARGLRFKEGQEKRQVRASEALAQKRDAETYSQLLLTDPKAAEIWAKARGIEAKTRTEDQLRDPRVRKAGADASVSEIESVNRQRQLDMEFDDTMSRISSRDKKQKFRRLELNFRAGVEAMRTETDAEKTKAGLIKHYSSMMQKYISSLTQFDPVFGQRDKEAAEFLKKKVREMGANLVALGEKSEDVETAISTLVTKQHGARQGGGSAMEALIGRMTQSLEDSRNTLDRLKAEDVKTNTGN